MCRAAVQSHISGHVIYDCVIGADRVACVCACLLVNVLNCLRFCYTQVVAEQENVKRVQLADAYLGGAELAGAEGTSMPEAIGAGDAQFSW